jgi:hypothetical protein
MARSPWSRTVAKIVAGRIFRAAEGDRTDITGFRPSDGEVPFNRTGYHSIARYRYDERGFLCRRIENAGADALLDSNEVRANPLCK